MSRLYRTLIKQSFEEALAYRGTTILTIIFGILFYAIAILTGSVYFSFAKDIFGWDFMDYLNLVTTANAMTYLYEFLFVQSQEALTSQILEGTLDYSLIRPVNTYWFHALYRVDFPSLIPLILTVGIEWVIIARIRLSFSQILLYILIVMLGTLFIFCLNQIAVTATFWIDGLSALAGLPEYIMDASTRPARIYPKLIQVLFLWILPSLTVTNIPVILRYRMPFGAVIWLAIVDAFLLIVSKFEWKRGLKHYVSAN